jgi:hypothetical protein
VRSLLGSEVMISYAHTESIPKSTPLSKIIDKPIPIPRPGRARRSGPSPREQDFVVVCASIGHSEQPQKKEEEQPIVAAAVILEKKKNSQSLPQL